MKYLEATLYISLSFFFIVSGIGNYVNDEAEKELLELKIEETKINIKILKLNYG